MSSRLEIVMACHYTSIAEPYAMRQPEHRRSRAVAEIHARWLRKGYLVPCTDPFKILEWGIEYEATDALRVYTDALMSVHQPELVERWEIPT